MTAYDTIFLGSSPNALIAAAYLARARQRVLVLESSPQIGGAVSTAEFADGFCGDIGLTSGRLDPSIVKDLQLDQHGLEMIERKTISSLLPDGHSFTLTSDCDQAVKAIGKFASKDAARYKQFVQLLDLARDFLQTAYAMTPPHAHHPAAVDVRELTALVARLRGYGRREMTEVIRLLVMPIRDLLDEWFENAHLKGLLASPAVRGLTQGPFAGGTTFNLLHHLAIGDGYFRATARGGVGAISRALADAAKSYGAELRTNVGVARVVVIDGIATGVVLDDHERIDSTKVVSDYDARYTFRQLVAPSELEPEFNRAVQHIRYNGSVARINLALRELPKFAGLHDDALRGTLVTAASVDNIERAFDDAKNGGLSHNPVLEVTIPTLTDATLAPADKHVMSIWFQYAPYQSNLLSESVLEVALATLSEFAPNLRSLVLHSQVVMPHDYEAQFHLTEGHLYGGDMTLSQAFFLRPIPGFAQYRTPVEHLYLCGSATHPGGGISGLAGANAAKELGLASMAVSV